MKRVSAYAMLLALPVAAFSQSPSTAAKFEVADVHNSEKSATHRNPAPHPASTGIQARHGVL